MDFNKDNQHEAGGFEEYLQRKQLQPEATPNNHSQNPFPQTDQQQYHFDPNTQGGLRTPNGNNYVIPTEAIKSDLDNMFASLSRGKTENIDVQQHHNPIPSNYVFNNYVPQQPQHHPNEVAFQNYTPQPQFSEIPYNNGVSNGYNMPPPQFQHEFHQGAPTPLQHQQSFAVQTQQPTPHNNNEFNSFVPYQPQTEFFQNIPHTQSEIVSGGSQQQFPPQHNNISEYATYNPHVINNEVASSFTNGHQYNVQTPYTSQQFNNTPEVNFQHQNIVHHDNSYASYMASQQQPQPQPTVQQNTHYHEQPQLTLQQNTHYHEQSQPTLQQNTHYIDTNNAGFVNYTPVGQYDYKLPEQHQQQPPIVVKHEVNPPTTVETKSNSYTAPNVDYHSLPKTDYSTVYAAAASKDYHQQYNLNSADTAASLTKVETSNPPLKTVSAAPVTVSQTDNANNNKDYLSNYPQASRVLATPNNVKTSSAEKSSASPQGFIKKSVITYETDKSSGSKKTKYILESNAAKEILRLPDNAFANGYKPITPARPKDGDAARDSPLYNLQEDLKRERVSIKKIVIETEERERSILDLQDNYQNDFTRSAFSYNAAPKDSIAQSIYQPIANAIKESIPFNLDRGARDNDNTGNLTVARSPPGRVRDSRSPKPKSKSNEGVAQINSMLVNLENNGSYRNVEQRDVIEKQAVGGRNQVTRRVKKRDTSKSGRDKVVLSDDEDEGRNDSGSKVTFVDNNDKDRRGEKSYYSEEIVTTGTTTTSSRRSSCLDIRVIIGSLVILLLIVLFAQLFGFFDPHRSYYY
jgi:hypothetical protein